MELEQVLSGFVKNFLSATIFYIPEYLVEESMDKEVKARMRGFTNKLVLIEKNGNNYFLDKSNRPCALHIIKKDLLLKDNIYVLLGYQNSEPERSFKFIMERYLEHFKVYLALSKKLLHNVRNDIPDLTIEQFKCFEYQYGYFSGHAVELAKNFGADENNKTTQDWKDIPLDGLLQNSSIFDEQNIIKQNKVLKPIIQLTKKDRLNKLTIETEEKADALVLKIFGIEELNYE